MDNIDNIFANTAVFCKECGQQLNPGDKFCRACGSTQTQEINIERLYAADVGWAAGAGRYAGSA